ncbi:hypothetical protein IKP13_08080 [bacterium]|nr:hypothetical protein [bacterium]
MKKNVEDKSTSEEMKPFEAEFDDEFEDESKKEILHFRFVMVNTIDKLSMDSSSFQKQYQTDKLTWFSDRVGCSPNNGSDYSGVYVFVLKDDFKFSKSLMNETQVYQKKLFWYIKTDYNVASPKTNYFPSNETLIKGKVLYSGKSEKLLDRLHEHLTSKSFSGTRSLKLGFPKRSRIKKSLDCYVMLLNPGDNRKYEKALHDRFKRYFGDKKV